MTNTNTNTADNVADKHSILARYRRAEALEQATEDDSMVLNAQIYPQWIGTSNCFWYKRSSWQNGAGTEALATAYRLVDASAGTNTEAFDHSVLATVLAEAAKQTVDATALPISQLEFDLENNSITFDAFEQRWQFDGAVKPVASKENYPAHWLVSPNEKKAAFVKDHNLWVRDLDSGEERALTHDGEKHYAYAVIPESRDLIGDLYAPVPVPKPEAQWSPDSTRLFTLQTDERQVRSLPSMLYVPQDGSVAPRAVERKYPLPGDKHPGHFRLLIIDVETATEIPVAYSPLIDAFAWQCPFSGNAAWWSGDGCQVYFVDMTRGQKTARLVTFDTHTGISKVLFEECSQTYLELSVDYEFPAMLVHLPETNELIWPSERSGWRHLYRYDLTTGELKNAITAGDWVVRQILHFDKDHRELWIQLAGRVDGRNPYYREIARVNIDTGDMTVLASGDHDYRVFKHRHMSISASSQFVVMARSRVDEAPVTELRNRQGEIVLTVETADISGLPESWQWPEPVSMKADDGSTDIYGVVFRPSNFDPDKQYPVLDFGMAASMYSFLPVGAFLPISAETGLQNPLGNAYYMGLAALAELGFIVTSMDGRGTPYRSKAFNDFAYGSFLEGGGLVDHVAGIKQLAERYPYMDLDRVGIITGDAPSNAAVYGLLQYPEFFKVGVAFAPAQPELIRQGEAFYGISADNTQPPFRWHDLAHRLEGKLLVVTGLLDIFFHASCTFQIADAMAKANKDFDLQIHPNGGHALRVINAHRRAWDYVVRHLLGEEPPKNFKLITHGEKGYPSIFPELSAQRIDE